MNTDGEETAICNTEAKRGGGESLSSFKSLKILCVLPLTHKISNSPFLCKGQLLVCVQNQACVY